MASHVPESQWPVLQERGWANVHMDLLQFLTEFGLIGTVFLLAALFAMLSRLFRRTRCQRDAFYVMGSTGLVLTVLFSCIDIPFRCPAILYTWIALLAAMPEICRSYLPACKRVGTALITRDSIPGGPAL